ncbi:MAG: ABC transporter substrate-binding protein [Sporichthyaceae bacterium]
MHPPFKEITGAVLAGHRIWLEEANAAGGVCGRQVALETRDHGYKAETAKVQFPEIEPKVAAFLQLLGSPVLAALGDDVRDRKVIAMAGSWSSLLLDNPYLLVPGATYDIEMINALSHLLKKRMIAPGDTIGHIYIDGEFGGNAFLGAKHFAEQHNIKLQAAKITPTDADMVNIVTGFKGDKVKAIAVSGTGTQTASAASKALGLGVPIVSHAVAFVPQLLESPAAAALDKLIVVGSAVPYTAEIPKVAAVREAFESGSFGIAPTLGVNLGYALGVIMGEILERACAAGDLSREGIAAALAQSTQISTDGIIPDLDFSNPGAPPSRRVYLAVTDAGAEGGLRPIANEYTSPDAQSYRAPHQQS